MFPEKKTRAMITAALVVELEMLRRWSDVFIHVMEKEKEICPDLLSRFAEWQIGGVAVIAEG